jgi:hypothetical protein
MVSDVIELEIGQFVFEKRIDRRLYRRRYKAYDSGLVGQAKVIFGTHQPTFSN